jgi:hypothetical protein
VAGPQAEGLEEAAVGDRILNHCVGDVGEAERERAESGEPWCIGRDNVEAEPVNRQLWQCVHGLEQVIGDLQQGCASLIRVKLVVLIPEGHELLLLIWIFF